MPDIVFDYTPLVAEGGRDTVTDLVTRGRRRQMLFVHVFPRKGSGRERGSKNLMKDIHKLGYQELILKCDGWPALTRVPEKVRNCRESTTMWENTGMGNSQVTGVGDKATQARGGGGGGSWIHIGDQSQELPSGGVMDGRACGGCAFQI